MQSVQSSEHSIRHDNHSFYRNENTEGVSNTLVYSLKTDNIDSFDQNSHVNGSLRQQASLRPEEVQQLISDNKRLREVIEQLRVENSSSRFLRKKSDDSKQDLTSPKLIDFFQEQSFVISKTKNENEFRHTLGQKSDLIQQKYLNGDSFAQSKIKENGGMSLGGSTSNTKYNTEIAFYQDKIQEMQIDIEVLIQEIEKYQNINLEDNEKLIKQCQMDNQDLKFEISQLKNQNHILLQIQSELSLMIKKYEQEIKEQQKQIISYQSTIKKYENQIQDLTYQIKSYPQLKRSYEFPIDEEQTRTSNSQIKYTNRIYNEEQIGISSNNFKIENSPSKDQMIINELQDQNSQLMKISQIVNLNWRNRHEQLMEQLVTLKAENVQAKTQKKEILQNFQEIEEKINQSIQKLK